MRVHDILASKGSAVLTLTRDATVGDLLATLADHRIGAVVVVDGDAVVGIASERDAVRHLRSDGSTEAPITALMTADVVTCTRNDDLQFLAETMTHHRFRHLPVVEDGKLVGLVSIGDVVKHRLDELQLERDQLQQYVQRSTT